VKPEANTKDFLNYHHRFRNGFTLARLLISLYVLFFNLAPTDTSSLCPRQTGEKEAAATAAFPRPPASWCIQHMDSIRLVNRRVAALALFGPPQNQRITEW